MLLLDINKFISENDLKQVTTANIMRAEKFDDNGLFSTIIFGLPNSARWRSNYGYIELNTLVLHPLLYEIADRRASALLKFFTGEKNNMPVCVKIGEEIKPCGAIYLTKEIKQFFEEILGSENIIVKENN